MGQAQNLVLVHAPSSTRGVLARWAREGLQQLIGLDSRMALARLAHSSYHSVQLNEQNLVLDQQVGQTCGWVSELNSRNQALNQQIVGLEQANHDLAQANQLLNRRITALEQANQGLNQMNNGLNQPPVRQAPVIQPFRVLEVG